MFIAVGKTLFQKEAVVCIEHTGTETDVKAKRITLSTGKEAVVPGRIWEHIQDEFCPNFSILPDEEPLYF